MDKLFQETGHSSIDDRNQEATRLIDDLTTYKEAMQKHELSFIEDMFDAKERNALRCSAKQLFWLRDLYEKYCC